MKRRPFTFISAISLVLCLATCALWIRSYCATDQILYFGADYRGWGAYLPEGRVALYRAFVSNPETLPPINARWYFGHDYPAIYQDIVMVQLINDPHRHSFFGGCLREENEALFSVLNSSQFRTFIVGIPFWIIALLTALAPARLLTLRVLPHRDRAHHCRSCGYDLRATPDRCPECGTNAGAR